MPRGFPKKNIENNSQKTLDNNSSQENSASDIAFDVLTPDAELEKKSADVKEAPEVKISEKNTDEYTVDPFTGKKYLKPKGDAILTYESRGRIPQINIPGYVVIWPVNETDTTFYDLVQQGWDFLHPSTPGAEEAREVPTGSRRKDGVAIVHKPMIRSIEKHRAWEASREKIRQQKENDTIYNPGATLADNGQARGYTAREHRAPRITNRDMDLGMAQAFEKAMR